MNVFGRQASKRRGEEWVFGGNGWGVKDKDFVGNYSHKYRPGDPHRCLQVNIRIMRNGIRGRHGHVDLPSR